MFYVFKHNKYPEYRLIVPKEADLPAEIRQEWTLFEINDRIEAEKEEDITKSGYHLYRCSQ